MFNGFSKMKLGVKITAGFILVLVISLISGITLGKNITSPYVIFGLIVTMVISMFIAFWVTKNVTTALKKIIQDLSLAESNLDNVSKEMTKSGHRLAEGTSQQAASIQETSSTLEESASMVHQTTQNTKEADVLAKHAKTSADKGNVEMNTMLELMEELKKSSGEISKIIRVIDEIAFQTNILSLNAAVEAARAGDAGKGFAVVAEEVRNLAQRSANAAKDTAGIIESNINLSEKCLDITNVVSKSLGEIKNETHKVSELLGEISTASQEQEIGIRQINQAISQMETVIQSNAYAAQESAMSADNLHTYAESLKDIMASLVGLIEGGGIQSNSMIIEKPAFMNVKKPKEVHQIPDKKQQAPKKTSEPTNDRRVKKEVKKDAPIEGAKVVNPEDVIPLGDF